VHSIFFLDNFYSAKCNSINSNVTRQKISCLSPKSIDLSHMLALIHLVVRWKEIFLVSWLSFFFCEWMSCSSNDPKYSLKLKLNCATLHWRSDFDVCFLHLPVLVFMSLSWLKMHLQYVLTLQGSFHYTHLEPNTVKQTWQEFWMQHKRSWYLLSLPTRRGWGAHPDLTIAQLVGFLNAPHALLWSKRYWYMEWGCTT
jgi:hypothetical protein